MPRSLIAVLGAGVVVGIGVLVWKLQAEPERPTRAPAETAAQPKSPANDRGQLSPPEAKADEPDVDETTSSKYPPLPENSQYVEKVFARSIPNKIMSYVAGCYSGETGDDTMTINFTVEVYNRGRIAFSDVEVVKSMNHPQLEECAVDVIRELRFRKRQTPDMVRQEDIEISINDLVKRHKKFVRKDAEENKD